MFHAHVSALSRPILWQSLRNQSLLSEYWCLLLRSAWALKCQTFATSSTGAQHRRCWPSGRNSGELVKMGSLRLRRGTPTERPTETLTYSENFGCTKRVRHTVLAGFIGRIHPARDRHHQSPAAGKHIHRPNLFPH